MRNMTDSDSSGTLERSGQSTLDLETLPVVGPGEPLVPHDVYIDVMNPGQGPCRALEGQTAGSGHGFVAEKDVEPHIWDHLVRLDGEARLRQEQELETPSTEQTVTDIGHSH